MTKHSTDLPPREHRGPAKRTFSDVLHERAWPAFLGRPAERRLVLFLFISGVVGIDYLTGSSIRFPAYYAVPILLFAWYDGFLWGSLAGLGVITTRFTMEAWIWTSVPWPIQDSLINAGTTLFLIILLAWFAARAGQLTRELRLLWGLLPMCMYCHRLRTESGDWDRLEAYVTQRSEATFSHGICPACLAKRM